MSEVRTTISLPSSLAKQAQEKEEIDRAGFILDAMLDGSCGTPPLAVLAARQLGAKIILPPHKTWPFNPRYGIVVAARLIRESPSIIEDFLELHEDACNLIREHPEEAAKLVHSVVKIVKEDFAREVFRVSPKYCASLPGEYIDSTMALCQRCGRWDTSPGI